MTPTQAKSFLEHRLAELAKEAALGSQGCEPVTLQQDSVGRLSRMDAMQQQAMSLAAERRRAAEGTRIAAALKRIEDHEWGYCLACGEEIALARLANDPSVTQCIACGSGGGGNAG